MGMESKTRDFIYIADVLDASIKLAKSKNKIRYFQPCSGKQTSINELVKTIGVKKI